MLNLPVNLDIRLLGNVFRHKEFSNFYSLVTRQLKNLTHLLNFDDGAVAGKVFLKLLQDFLSIVLLGETLEGSYGFATIALLDTNVCKSRCLMVEG